MIRVSSSFAISLLLHGALLSLLFLSWRVLPSPSKKEEIIPLKIHNIILQKEIKKVQNVQKKQILRAPQTIKKTKKVVKKVIQRKHIATPKKIEKKVLKTTKNIQKTQTVQAIKKEIIPKEELHKVTLKKRKKPTVATSKTTQKPPNETYIHNHLREIAKLIQENLYYPRIARRRGIESKEIVVFTLLADGRVSDVKVKECKVEILCQAAIKTINALSGQFPKPAKELLLHVPINYRLKEE